MYALATDMENRLDPHHLIELADENRDGSPDTDVLEAAIQDADALIDSYLATRYVTPIQPTPPLLRKLSLDLAVTALFARRRESASPSHAERAKNALALLAALARGDILIPGLGESAMKRPIDSTTSGTAKQFSRDTLSQF